MSKDQLFHFEGETRIEGRTQGAYGNRQEADAADADKLRESVLPTTMGKLHISARLLAQDWHEPLAFEREADE